MTEDAIWTTLSRDFRLAADEVHVWRVDLGEAEREAGKLALLLSDDERKRADRFIDPVHSARFLFTRGMLRVLLGRYLGAAPESLMFTYGPHGKPALDRDGEGVCFNLSHSHEIALLAVALRRRVGVDVEFPRQRVDIDRLARRFFAPAEVESFLELPPRLRREGFYNCWTRKEAFLKARGEGITVSLDSFSVSLRPAAPVILMECRGDAEEAGRWRMRDLPLTGGYKAALCVEGGGWKLKCGAWEERA